MLQDRTHFGSKIKPLKIFKNWNHFTHVFWPQHYKIKYQLQKKKTTQNTNTWRLNNMLVNNQQITAEIKKEIKIYLGTNDNENTTAKNLWGALKAVLREVYNNTGLPAETREIPDKQPNLASSRFWVAYIWQLTVLIISSYPYSFFMYLLGWSVYSSLLCIFKNWICFLLFFIESWILINSGYILTVIWMHTPRYIYHKWFFSRKWQKF